MPPSIATAEVRTISVTHATYDGTALTVAASAAAPAAYPLRVEAGGVVGELPSPDPVTFPMTAPPASVTVSSGATSASAPVVITGGTVATTTARVVSTTLTAPRGMSISFDWGGPAGDTTVSSAMVTADSVANGTTLTVKGHVGADVNRDQLEQRRIQPDFKDTVIGRRDVRAIPGPVVPAPKGSYSSGISFTDTPDGADFTATYEFDTADLAATAAAADLGERAMSWQVQDGAVTAAGAPAPEARSTSGSEPVCPTRALPRSTSGRATARSRDRSPPPQADTSA